MSNIVQWATNLPSGYVSQTMLVILDGIDNKIVQSLPLVSKRFEPHLKLTCKRFVDYSTKEKCIIYILRIIYTIDHFGESEVGKCVIKISDRGTEVKAFIELDCEDTRIKSVELPLIREAIQSYKIFLDENINEMIRKLSDQIYQEQNAVAQNPQPKVQPYEENKNPQSQQKFAQPAYNALSQIQEKIPQQALNLQSPQNQMHPNAIDPRTLKNAMNRISGSDGIFAPKKEEVQVRKPKEDIIENDFNLENISKVETEEFPKPKVPNRAFQVRVPDPNSLRTSNTSNK